MLVLSAQDVVELLPMAAAIDAVEEGFRALGEGLVHVPERVHVSVGAESVLLLMPAVYSGRQAWMGVKLVSVFPENRGRALDVVQAVYVLQNGTTGETVAVMDAKSLTAIRTPATSALATRLLSRRYSTVLGIFGTGVQARGHVRAMREVRPIEEVLVCGISAADSEVFARQVVEREGIPARAASAEEVARCADILCTCTTSNTPVFNGELLRPGTHINGVGSFQPENRELDTRCVQLARVVVDGYSAALPEAGDLQIPLRNGDIDRGHVLAELTEVVLGKTAVRCSDEDITLFKSTGHAVEDLVCAVLAYERARAAGRGSSVHL